LGTVRRQFLSFRKAGSYGNKQKKKKKNETKAPLHHSRHHISPSPIGTARLSLKSQGAVAFGEDFFLKKTQTNTTRDF